MSDSKPTAKATAKATAKPAADDKPAAKPAAAKPAAKQSATVDDTDKPATKSTAKPVAPSANKDELTALVEMRFSEVEVKLTGIERKLDLLEKLVASAPKKASAAPKSKPAAESADATPVKPAMVANAQAYFKNKYIKAGEDVFNTEIVDKIMVTCPKFKEDMNNSGTVKGKKDEAGKFAARIAFAYAHLKKSGPKEMFAVIEAEYDKAKTDHTFAKKPESQKEEAHSDDDN